MGLLTFSMQIGLVRESVTIDVTEPLTVPTLKDFACAFVDRKVRCKDCSQVLCISLPGPYSNPWIISS